MPVLLAVNFGNYLTLFFSYSGLYLCHSPQKVRAVVLLHFILRQQSREDVGQHWCLSVRQRSCHNSRHVCYFSQCIGVSVSHLCYGVCWGVAVLLLLLLALIRVTYSLMDRWIFSCPRRCWWHDFVRVFCFYQVAAELSLMSGPYQLVALVESITVVCCGWMAASSSHLVACELSCRIM